MASQKGVAVIIGTGGIGQAVARALANDHQLLLADFSSVMLAQAVEALKSEGHEVQTQAIDVSNHESVASLAQAAAKLGHIHAIVNTAGVSTIQSPGRRILEVDLLGTANILDAFLAVASQGTSAVFISSIAGHIFASTMSDDLQNHLATAPLDKLLEHPEMQAAESNAYGIAKRGNILRVQSATRAWGLKGARVNTVSPGMVQTSMAEEEMAGPLGPFIKQMVESSGAQRIGRPDELAHAIAFLVDPKSSYITGSDILVDGGSVATQKWKEANETGKPLNLG